MIELNKEGLIDIESTKVLLKESNEIFKDRMNNDRKFVDRYERKLEMRRMIRDGNIPQHL